MSYKRNSDCRIARSARQRSTRRGATALEFALVTPTMLIVIFVSFEFAKLAMMQSLAQCAAYEACRNGVVEGATSDEIVAEARRILARLGTGGADVVINDGVAMTALDSELKVSISIPMENNCLILSGYFSDRYVNAETTLRTERYTGYYDGGSDDDE